MTPMSNKMVLPTPMPTMARVLRVVCGTERRTNNYVCSLKLRLFIPFHFVFVASSPKQQDKIQNRKPGFEANCSVLFKSHTSLMLGNFFFGINTSMTYHTQWDFQTTLHYVDRISQQWWLYLVYIHCPHHRQNMLLNQEWCQCSKLLWLY